MIVEDFDVLFNTDIFAQPVLHKPLAGPSQNINVIINQPYMDVTGVESKDITLTAPVQAFLTYPTRGDEVIIGKVNNQVSYIIITPEVDITGDVVVVELELK